MVPIGFPGPVSSEAFHFNMYTATGFFSAVVGIINVVLLIVVFKEHTVHDDQFTSTSIQSGGTYSYHSLCNSFMFQFTFNRLLHYIEYVIKMQCTPQTVCKQYKDTPGKPLNAKRTEAKAGNLSLFSCQATDVILKTKVLKGLLQTHTCVKMITFI